MEHTRRNFLHGSLLVAGAAALTGAKTFAAERAPEPTTSDKTNANTQAPMPTSTPQTSASATNILGGDKFDPAQWLVVPPRTFKDLKVGDVFRAPSRTLTEAHTSAFQAISLDNHPRHFNVEYAKGHGLQGPLVHPLQVLCFTALGATLLTHYIGEVLIAFTDVSANFARDSFVGDTLYSALEIAEVSTEGDKGFVQVAAMIFNQRGELVLSGQQKLTLKLA